VKKVATQPKRAPASRKFAQEFVPPDTYPPNVPVPLPPNPPVLPVPTDITPQEDIELAYALYATRMASSSRMYPYPILVQFLS